MPIVIVKTWPLKGEERAKIIKEVTNVFVEMGIPAQAVTVIIEEIPKENWGTGGEQHSVKFGNKKI